MWGWLLCIGLLVAAVALLAAHARREHALHPVSPAAGEGRLCSSCSKKALLGKGAIAWSTVENPTSSGVTLTEARLRRKRQWLLTRGASFLDQVARRDYTEHGVTAGRCVECRCRLPLPPDTHHHHYVRKGKEARNDEVDHPTEHSIDVVVTHVDLSLEQMERECQRLRENL